MPVAGKHRAPSGQGRLRIRRLTLGLILGTLAASGCQRVEDGINAYYVHDYETAVRYLSSPASRLAKRAPEVSLSMDRHTTLEQALPAATQRGFALWEAYAGSLIGLGRVDEGCRAIASALRPIRVEVNGKWLEKPLDPKQGSYWPSETFSLRSWRANLPCRD